ncbi:MAG: RFC-like complex subunit Ctf18 [Amphiamblys sp. WSBS2006]|nr:MAG: RFC-like complex subunit Ctf18 [Amphiamblys sp. WSBS2006]
MKESGGLWVSKYAPQRFTDLLSDDETNRRILQWCVQWKRYCSGEDRRKKPGVVLLCGPPGTGKTTLARLVADTCGFSPVELNASCERSLQEATALIKNAASVQRTVTKSMPNMLIVDEIDGMYSSGRGNLGDVICRVGGEGGSGMCPILCICNEMYDKKMYNLRKGAAVYTVQKPDPERLASRLREICLQERLVRLAKDTAGLLGLCREFENDIRGCVGFLEMFSKKGEEAIDMAAVSSSRRNMQLGLFRGLEKVFRSRQSKTDFDSTSKYISFYMNESENKGLLLEKCFDSYLSRLKEGSRMEDVCDVLDWVVFNDEANAKNTEKYGSFLGAKYHMRCSSSSSWIEYKHEDRSTERLLRRRNQGIIDETCQKAGKWGLRDFVDNAAYMAFISAPVIKATSMLTERERASIRKAADFMSGAGLAYTGDEDAVEIEPNIFEYCFEDRKEQRKSLKFIKDEMGRRKRQKENKPAGNSLFFLGKRKGKQDDSTQQTVYRYHGQHSACIRKRVKFSDLFHD